jgi:hypothetical protein|tara:strand:- start:998 stop:2209 length:1212 start_codon:yes stop_codon:yes gene_type:complete
MSHGGYHGTQIMGGKITQLGDEFKDSQGNIKPDFNVTGDRESGFRVEASPNMARLPNIPDQLFTPDMRLQNLINQKDVLKLQASPNRPGMNVYQDAMQNFRTTNDANMSAYADRFPLTQFMMTAPEKIASKTMLGNVISSIGNRYNQAKDFAGGLFPGDNTMLNKMAGDFAALPGKFKKDAGQMISDFQNLTPDLDEGVSTVRDFLGIKKNNATDIVETALGAETLDQGSNAGEEQFYGGRSPMDEMFANSGIASQLFGKQYREEDMRGKGVPFSDVEKGLDEVRESGSNLGKTVNEMLDEILRQQNLEGAFNTRNQIDLNNQFDVAELNKKQQKYINQPTTQTKIQKGDKEEAGGFTPVQLFEQLQKYDKKPGLLFNKNPSRVDFDEDIKPLFPTRYPTVVS